MNWHIPSSLYLVERVVGYTWVQVPLPVLNFNSMILLFLFLMYCLQLCALINLAEYNIPDWIKFCAFIPIIGLIAEIIAVLFYRT